MLNAEIPTLLIVDDEEDLREILTFELAPLGAQLATAANGAEALKVVESREVDLILLDVMMPGMNGIEFLKQLRGQAIETPVVFLTAHADKELALQAMRLGASDMLDKPYSVKNLRGVVMRVLEIESRKHELKEKEGTLSPDEVRRRKKMLALLQIANQSWRDR